VFQYLPFCFAGSWIMLLTCLLRRNLLTLNMDLGKLAGEMRAAAPAVCGPDQTRNGWHEDRPHRTKTAPRVESKVRDRSRRLRVAAGIPAPSCVPQTRPTRSATHWSDKAGSG